MQKISTVFNQVCQLWKTAGLNRLYNFGAGKAISTPSIWAWPKTQRPTTLAKTVPRAFARTLNPWPTPPYRKSFCRQQPLNYKNFLSNQYCTSKRDHKGQTTEDLMIFAISP